MSRILELKKTILIATVFVSMLTKLYGQVTITFANGNFTYAPLISTVALNGSVTFNGNFASHPMVEVSQADWCNNSNNPLAGGIFVNTGTTYNLNTSIAGDRYFVCQPHVSLGMKCKVSIGCNTGAPTGVTTQTYTPGSMLNNLIVNGTNVKWYTSTSSNCPTTNTTQLVNGTTYYATQTIGGCESTTQLPILVTASCSTPSVYILSGGGSYCNGGAGVSISLSGSQTNVNYQLKNGATNVGSPLSGTGSAINFTNITAAGTYSVEATTTTGGCSSSMSGSVNVIVKQNSASSFSASACGNYTWNNINYTTSGIKTLTIPNAAGCDSVMTLSLTINALPEPMIMGNTTICSGKTTTLSAMGANTYTWSTTETTMDIAVSPTVITSYTLMGTDANGCEGNAITSVTVNTLPTIMASTSNTLLCTGQTASLTAMGANTYTWNTNETTMEITVSPTTTMIYTVTGTDAKGCVNTTTVQQDVSLCTAITFLSNTDILINVYPNPSKGLFVVELNTASTLTITDVLGKIILTQSIKTGKNLIDLSACNTGVYFLSVANNGLVNKTKLIKE